MGDQTLNSDVHFSLVQPKSKRNEGALGGYRLYGDRHLNTSNDPNGLTFIYYLKESAKEKVSISITDSAGSTVRTLEGTGKAGLNRVIWNFSPPQLAGRNEANQREILSGEYSVTLQVGDQKYKQKAQVLR